MPQAAATARTPKTPRRPAGRIRLVPRTLAVAAEADHGISKARALLLFKKIAAYSLLPTGKLRAQVIPESSWKRAGETLGTTASQTVARIERILAYANTIFIDEENSIEWLNGKHWELNRVTPFSLLGTEAGGQAVEYILVAADHGFPA